jgi:hypothetical protein
MIPAVFIVCYSKCCMSVFRHVITNIGMKRVSIDYSNSKLDRNYTLKYCHSCCCVSINTIISHPQLMNTYLSVLRDTYIYNIYVKTGNTITDFKIYVMNLKQRIFENQVLIYFSKIYLNKTLTVKLCFLSYKRKMKQ